MKPPRMQFAGPGQSPGDYTNHEQSPDDLYLLRRITLRMQFAGPGQSPGDYTNHEQSPDDLYLLRMITLRMQFAGPGQSPGDYTNHKQSPDDLYLLRMFSPRMQFARPGLLVRPSLFGIVSKNMCNIFIINQFIVASGLFHIAGIANSSISYFKWKNSSDVVQPFQKTVIKSF